MLTAVLALTLVAGAVADVPVPAGQIQPRVETAADVSQTYALYLPSKYAAERAWPVIFLFDPGGRGLNGVERYQAAAEQYGYIVAGSNNSRNGQPSRDAIVAMTSDVMKRFHVDMTRIYTGGMSGGARVAMGVALSSTATRVAGVFASSAGYPDGQVRKTLPFPVFATAGTEDFNHLEMRTLDRELTTPHHLAIFEGAHVWLSSDLALQGVEWMELQAMKKGLKLRDDDEVSRLLAKRIAAAGASRDKEAYLALQSIADDFAGLRDVKDIAARAAALARDKSVVAALKADRDEDERENRMLADVFAAEERLTGDRAAALADLRQKWQRLSEDAKSATDTLERRLARRVLSGLSAGGTSTADPEYLQMVREFRLGRGGRGAQQ